jgi:predicted MFS family arabinose efflux permease
MGASSVPPWAADPQPRLGFLGLGRIATDVQVRDIGRQGRRSVKLGIWGAVAGAGGAAGVLLGGILTSGLSWRWVLFVNVPIGLVAALLAPRTLVESRAEDGTTTFDLPGAVTVTAGLSLAFLVIELRQRHPLMPFSIFRLRTLRGANIVSLLIGMALFSMFFFISLYLQDVLHYSPIKTGISYLPLAVGIIFPPPPPPSSSPGSASGHP